MTKKNISYLLLIVGVVGLLTHSFLWIALPFAAAAWVKGDREEKKARRK